VSGHLPREIVSDFERINAYRRAEDRLRETESTINRLRSLFSPILQAIFSHSEHTIDFREIVRQRGILLVNLRETEYFSADQANALGGLFIHQVLSSAATTERDLRVPYYLVIDEAARFVGDDLQRALGECRKFKLSVILAAQDLSSFKKKDFDMTQKVLSQCRSQICFQQQHPDDLEVLSRVLCYGNLDFTELQQVMDRPDGYDWVDVEEHSEGTSRQTNWSESEGTSTTKTESQQRSRTESAQESWQRTESEQRSVGHTDAYGTNTSDSVGKSWSATEGKSQGTGRAHTFGGHTSLNSSDGTSSSSTSGESVSRSVGTSESHAYNESQSRGTSSSIGGAKGFSEGESHGQSHGLSSSKQQSHGGSEGETQNISHRRVPLARHREEWHATGRLERGIEDQLAHVMQLLHSLPTRHALVKLVDVPRAFPIRVSEVNEPFVSSKVKAYAVSAFRDKLHATHSYFFTPDFGAAEQDRRIDTFIETNHLRTEALNGHTKDRSGGTPSINGHRKEEFG
jgi:hypothetical protein